VSHRFGLCGRVFADYAVCAGFLDIAALALALADVVVGVVARCMVACYIVRLGSDFGFALALADSFGFAVLVGGLGFVGLGMGVPDMGGLGFGGQVFDSFDFGFDFGAGSGSGFVVAL